MFVPTCSKGLINVQRGVDIWEPFPWDGTPHKGLAETGANDLGDISDQVMNEVEAELAPDAAPGAGSGSVAGSGSGAGSGEGSGAGSGEGSGDTSLDGIQL
jgi:hypothetical protein